MKTEYTEESKANTVIVISRNEFLSMLMTFLLNTGHSKTVERLERAIKANRDIEMLAFYSPIGTDQSQTIDEIKIEFSQSL